MLPHTQGRLILPASLALAALFRLSVILYHGLYVDDATVALMAKHLLAGEAFPIFFYRLPYMGSLNSLYLVPTLFLLGPSVLVVRLSAVAYSLLFPLGLYMLGRRVFDEDTARAALVLAAVPPFLLNFWSTMLEPHSATPIFGVVLLLLALAAVEAHGPRYARCLGCFGLVAGLGWWTNFGVLQVLIPTFLVLWVRDWRLPLRLAGGYLAGGFLIGSLPAWLFYLMHADPAGKARGLFQPELVLSASRFEALFTTARTLLLGWYYWPPDNLLRGAAGLATIGVYVAATTLALIEAFRQAHHDVPRRRYWGIWMLLLTLLTVIVALYAARHVSAPREPTHYVLAVYIPLLLFVSLFVARLWRRSRALGAALLCFVLAYHIWTNAPFMWLLNVPERARHAAHIAAREDIVQYLKAHPVEALYVDPWFTSPGWAFLLTGIRVSELTSEVHLPSAVVADAADHVPVLIESEGNGVIEGLDGLRATYRITRFGQARLLDEIRVPARQYRLIPRENWRLRGERRKPSAVADGDLATAWPSDPPPGLVPSETEVDLAVAYALGRVIWWPSTDSARTPPLALSVSLDGTAWEPIGVLPTPDRERRPAFVAGGRPYFRPRNGWLELRLEPRLTRYLRFAPADPGSQEPWGIAEVYAYEDAGPRAEVRMDLNALVTRLREHGIQRLLADPAISARVARASRGTIRTVTANGYLDSHGRDTPPARLAWPVELQPADALLVPREDAEDLRARLAAARLTFVEEPAGEYVLFSRLSGLEAAPNAWAWGGRTLFAHSGRVD